ncbi:hypothetical protein AArcSl_2813 [Halalkaliarchaeum desulfuricum]|uniref:RNA ligase domain-containing protein n=1 Tax=Halalkaliarchaeum desulfuricum TaxID=2055893 RepID=A0A343TMV6_9EURY|nr:hypothetical protein [Halalkaliarchaeum desulfuricum]AUX10428.1 hypothetical protein AArcSl_2813 [Halalkaliarchaeum desulfuricum]
MRPYPPAPDLEAVDGELFGGGHLWIREWIDGAPLRFQLQHSGVVRFGDAERVFGDDDVPDAYRHAVRHVRERLDREALVAAVEDVESVVLFGVATQRLTVEYDFDRLPSVLGVEVWSDDGFLPPDAADRVFERLGLEPINAVRKEISPRDFDPSPAAIPDSQWYDGPAAGIEIRNTRGPRGKLLHPDLDIESGSPPEPITASTSEFAREYATGARLDWIAGRLETHGTPVTVDSLYERLLEDALRRHHRRLHHPESTVDLGALRSELAAIAGEYLGS